MTLNVTPDDLTTLQTVAFEQTTGVTTFICAFDTPVDPQAFCDRVFDGQSEYGAWGAKIPIQSNPETGDEYWKVPALLHEPDVDEPDTVTSCTVEVAPKYMRCYLTEDADCDRIYAFLDALDDEYGLTVELPEVPTNE